MFTIATSRSRCLLFLSGSSRPLDYFIETCKAHMEIMEAIDLF
jgi:hypothetical protein